METWKKRGRRSRSDGGDGAWRRRKESHERGSGGRPSIQSPNRRAERGCHRLYGVHRGRWALVGQGRYRTACSIGQAVAQRLKGAIIYAVKVPVGWTARDPVVGLVVASA